MGHHTTVIIPDLEGNSQRVLTSWHAHVGTLIMIAFSLFHLYRSAVGPLSALPQRSVHLGLVLAMTFLLFPIRRRGTRTRPTIADLALILGAGTVAFYIYSEYLELTFRAGLYTSLDIAYGFLAIVLVLEATRRVTGNVLPALSLIFLAYAYLGPYIPGLFAHRGYDLPRIVSHMYLSTEGIFGTPLGVSASLVAIFIIFGAFLQVSGAGQFFTDLAFALFGRARGGAAKLPILSSALFGTISGSAVANVVVDGAITIPLMKRAGYPPHRAAAIEAVASTGGQLMPPIMGAAAFIMSEITDIPYISIAAAAAISAVLYYVSLYFMVDFEAARSGVRGLPSNELPSVRRVLREGWHLLIPIVILIYTLAVLDWSPTKSALWSIASTILVSWLNRATRMGPARILEALKSGASGAIEVALTCACAGIIVGVFSLTGLGGKLATIMAALASGNLLALLILTAVTVFVLGMGMPTVAAYLVLAVLVAPTLVEQGVPLLAAHLFIFYFGVLSAITPPVALAAYAAAGIAGCSGLQAGFAAVRYGLAGFILPFMFIYRGGILLDGTLWDIVFAATAGLFGVIALAGSIVGYFYERCLLPERVGLLLGAVLLIHPDLTADVLGYLLISIIFVRQFVASKKHVDKRLSQ